MKITGRQLRRIIKEISDDDRIEVVDDVLMTPWAVSKDPDRPWGSPTVRKGISSFYDVIVMSPHGDSVLVDGRETYLQDVPSQLQHASGIAMDDTTGGALVSELERQEASGYVELGVEYKNGQWSW